MIRTDTRSILIRFTHGLGDAAQLLTVLAAVHKRHPTTEVDVAAKRGKHSLFRGACRHAYSLDDDGIVIPPDSDYHQVYNLAWLECYRSFCDGSGSKAALCLREVLRIPSNPVPVRYDCPESILPLVTDPADAERVEEFVATLSNESFACIHYQGNTSSDRKDLDHATVKRFCQLLLANDVTPVILDWDSRSPLPDNKIIFCPGVGHPLWKGYGTGDGAALAALIARAKLFVGIDSGPLHVAELTATPILACWTEHHPYHYANPSEHALHLVPTNHEERLRGDRMCGLKYFLKHYAHREYESLGFTLGAEATRILGLKVQIKADDMHELRSTAYAEGYYEEHKKAGLDYLGHGQWQEGYGRWLVDVFGLKGKVGLDVGCACGSIAAGLHKAGLVTHGTDLSNHMVHLGKQKFKLASLNVCDAVNLHLFGDRSFDFIHANQTFEHFRPELVPFILAELKRALKPGAVLWTVHDTSELYEREGRDPAQEDPTHCCIVAKATWDEWFAEAGFEDVSEEHRAALMDHDLSYLRQYNWDWWVLRKPAKGA